MPKGTPLWPKCPACKRGQYGELSIEKGTFKTGRFELRVTRSGHKGSGSGGSSFIGHRGEMQCRDCGHLWYSTHAASDRIRCPGGELCTHTEPDPAPAR